MIVNSVTGPGRLRLDLGGIGGCAKDGGSEGGQDDKRLEVMSEVELRTRGISRAIVFALLLLIETMVLFSFVQVPPTGYCVSRCLQLVIASGVDLPPPARKHELPKKAEPNLVDPK